MAKAKKTASGKIGKKQLSANTKRKTKTAESKPQRKSARGEGGRRFGARTIQICTRIPPEWLKLASAIAKQKTPAVKRAAILREAIRLGLGVLTGKSVASVG